MLLPTVRIPHGRAGNRDPECPQRKRQSTTARPTRRAGTCATRLEHGKAAVDRGNAGFGASSRNPGYGRDLSRAAGLAAAAVGKDRGGSQTVAVAFWLRGTGRGFEAIS